MFKSLKRKIMRKIYSHILKNIPEYLYPNNMEEAKKFDISINLQFAAYLIYFPEHMRVNVASGVVKTILNETVEYIYLDKKGNMATKNKSDNVVRFPSEKS